MEIQGDHLDDADKKADPGVLGYLQAMAGSKHLSSADKADPGVLDYLRATAEVKRLEAALADARAEADALAAEMETQAGPARGRLERLAAHLRVRAQSLSNQRLRGKRLQREKRLRVDA